MVGGRLAVHSKLYRHIVFNIKIELQFYYLPTLLKKSFRLKKNCLFFFSSHAPSILQNYSFFSQGCFSRKPRKKNSFFFFFLTQPKTLQSHPCIVFVITRHIVFLHLIAVSLERISVPIYSIESERQRLKPSHHLETSVSRSIHY